MFHQGQHIGLYTLVRKLANGGFGEVWLAEKQSEFITKKVAIKLPHDHQVDFEAIRQEATLWEQASGHPNVLPIIDADVYDGQASHRQRIRRGRLACRPLEFDRKASRPRGGRDDGRNLERAGISSLEKHCSPRHQTRQYFAAGRYAAPRRFRYFAGYSYFDIDFRRRHGKLYVARIF